MNINVNTTGLNMIAKWLADHHVSGVDLSDANVRSWAAEVERHAADSNGAYLELRAHESIRGRTEVFDLPDEGYDVAKKADEWNRINP
ncbi:hypothetical protein [Paracidovorax valerianellae]|uniref:hypothetical protein n=1 Tax=Paracidovorax valerianellae TaxID=187868 RepID=UPI002303A984|nr:hypothetical protein [Paracidovorax valerianellae]MDA8444771.1 hypothetical protein [Paracidovorax valerianellae]